MEATHQGCLNTDIASMLFAWGMELNEEVEIVKWVVRSLFEEELLGKLESLVEWVVLGKGYDVSKGIEDMDEATKEGMILFVRWRRLVDRDEYKLTILTAWENLKFLLCQQEEEERQEGGDKSNRLPRRRRFGSRGSGKG